MAVATKVKVGGAWKEVPNVQYRVGGVWKQVTDGLIKVGGVWKHFFQYGGGPAVSIDNPTGVSVINVNDVVSIQVTATDDDGIERVNFYVQGPEDVGYTLLGDDQADPFAHNWTPGVAGEWNIKAEAIDNVGLKGYDYLTVTVLQPGNIDPVAAITLPAPAAAFTAGDSVVINVTATDADGTVARVKFYADGAHIGDDTTGESDVFSFTWTAVAGVTELSAVAIDNQGGMSTEATVAITVAAAPSAPTVNITAPLGGATYNENNSVTLNFDYADVDGDAAEYQIWVNGVVDTAWTAVSGGGSSGSESVSVSPSGSGSFEIAVQVRDSGSRLSQHDYVNVVFNAANQAPTGTWITPSSGAVIEPGATVLLALSASDGDGSVTGVKFQIQGYGAGGNTYQSALHTAAYNATSGYWEYSVAMPNFSGTFYAKAWVTDDLSATTHVQETFSLNAKPTITAINDQSILSGSGTIFTGYSYHNHVDIAGGVTSDTHLIVLEGAPAGTTINTVQSGNEYVSTITVPSGVGIGTHNMKLKVTDSHWPTVEESFVLVVAQQDLAPTVTLTVDENNPKQGQTFTFTAIPNDPEGKLNYVEIQKEVSPGVWALETSQGHASGYFANDAPRTFAISRNSTGQYTFRARARDEGNNWGTSDPIVITVKTDYGPTYSGVSKFVFTEGAGGVINFQVNNPDLDDSPITITAETSSVAEAIVSTCASLSSVYDAANDRYDCQMTVPANAVAAIGVDGYPITIKMNDGYNPVISQEIRVKINASPVIFVGHLTVDLGERTAGVAHEWLIPMSDANGGLDIDASTLTVTGKPDSITVAVYSADGGATKSLKINWDGTDAAGSTQTFNVKIADTEGAWSEDTQFSFNVAAAVDPDLTWAGPSTVTARVGVNHYFTIEVTDPDGDNIADLSYVLTGGLLYNGTVNVVKSYKVNNSWGQGDPPTPEASVRRIQFAINPNATAMAGNPSTFTITATDHVGREFTHAVTVTVIPNA